MGTADGLWQCDFTATFGDDDSRQNAIKKNYDTSNSTQNQMLHDYCAPNDLEKYNVTSQGEGYLDMCHCMSSPECSCGETGHELDGDYSMSFKHRAELYTLCVINDYCSNLFCLHNGR